MCSGCSGDYEDGGRTPPDPDEDHGGGPSGLYASASTARPGFQDAPSGPHGNQFETGRLGNCRAGEQFRQAERDRWEVLVSTERIVEIRVIPANRKASSQLAAETVECAWKETWRVRKHSSAESAKYYQTSLLARGHGREYPSNRLICICLVLASVGLVALWLAFA
jgi:hypothetical protein